MPYISLTNKIKQKINENHANWLNLIENIEIKNKKLDQYKKENFDKFEPKKLDLLRKRKAVRKAKPFFRRYKSHLLKRIGTSWRRENNSQNKKRIEIKGKGSNPGKGFRKPRLVRNLNLKGYQEVIIKNLRDLEDNIANFRKVHFVISSKLGLKKRLIIENKIYKKGGYITNPIKYLNND